MRNESNQETNRKNKVMANEEKKEGKAQGGTQAPEKKAEFKQWDTTKSGLRPYLDKAAEKTKESFHAGSSLKRAAITFAADVAGLQGEARAHFAKTLDATPGWFFCGNNSACRQAYEAKNAEAEALKEYTDY